MNVSMPAMIPEQSDLLLRLVNGLVSNDQMLKQFASSFNSCDKLRGKQEVGDLGALRHDSGPDRKLCAVLGSGNGDIISDVTKLSHGVLVDNCPNEVVIAALGVLAKLMRARRSTWYGKSLSSIEGVDDGLNALDWC